MKKIRENKHSKSFSIGNGDARFYRGRVAAVIGGMPLIAGASATEFSKSAFLTPQLFKSSVNDFNI